MKYKEFKENIINELVKTKLFNKEEAEKYYLENKNFFIEKQFGIKKKQGRKKKWM